MGSGKSGSQLNFIYVVGGISRRLQIQLSGERRLRLWFRYEASNGNHSRCVFIGELRHNF